MSLLQAGARLLDLGCGSGTVTYATYPHLKFVGLDQQAYAGTETWPANAQLVRAEGEGIPFADASFDAVICNYVFEHVRDPRAVLHELDRVVRPGGLLYISVPVQPSLEDRLYRLTLRGGGHIQRYTLASLLALIYKETGFKLQTLAPCPGGYTWLRGVPYNKRIYSFLFDGFRALQKATDKNMLAENAYLFLFRLGEYRGFKDIVAVCSHCGNCVSTPVTAENGCFPCPSCGKPNIDVRRRELQPAQPVQRGIRGALGRFAQLMRAAVKIASGAGVLWYLRSRYSTETYTFHLPQFPSFRRKKPAQSSSVAGAVASQPAATPSDK